MPKLKDVVRTTKPVQVGTRLEDRPEAKTKPGHTVRMIKTSVPVMVEAGELAIVRGVQDAQPAVAPVDPTPGKPGRAGRPAIEKHLIIEFLDSPHRGTRAVPASSLAVGRLTFEG